MEFDGVPKLLIPDKEHRVCGICKHYKSHTTKSISGICGLKEKDWIKNIVISNETCDKWEEYINESEENVD